MNRSIYVFLALALTFLSACAPPSVTHPDFLQNIPKSSGEAIGTDMFALTAPSSEMSVAGVRIGMTQEQVLAILGTADKDDEYDFGAIHNWQYGKVFGLADTGFIIHFEQGKVTRITILEPLNQYLVGNTKIGLTKELVYAKFGTPDRQYDIKGGRFFVYNPRGLEIYLKNDVVSGYGLVQGNRRLPSTATLPGVKNDPFKPKTPRLITDTTTLCDQGKTQAFNPGSGECMVYGNACAIPDSWIEVKSCNPEDVTDDAVEAALRSQQ